MSSFVDNIMAEVKAKNPAQPEFHQAVEEVVESLEPVIAKHPEYKEAKVLERIIHKHVFNFYCAFFHQLWCHVIGYSLENMWQRLLRRIEYD